MRACGHALLTICLSVIALTGFSLTAGLAEAGVSLRQAMDLEATGKYDAAVQVFTQLVSTDPPSAPECLLHVAICRQAQSKFKEAIEAASQGIDKAKNPKDATILHALRDKLAVCYRLNGQWNNSISLNKALIAEHPEEAAAREHEIVFCYLGWLKYPEAIAAAKRGIEAATASKNSALLKSLRITLAQCYRMNSSFDESIEFAQSVAAEYPDDAALWQREIGLSYMAKENHQAALAAFKKGIDAAKLPQDKDLVKELRTQWAQCRRITKTPDAASNFLQLAADYPGDAATYRFWYAMCLKDILKWDAATAIFKELADADHSEEIGGQARIQQFACLMIVKNKDSEAEECFKKVWDEYPNLRPLALWQKGESFVLERLEWANAARAWKRLFAEYPNHPLTNQVKPSLIYALYQAGNLDEVIQFLTWLATNSTSAEEKAGCQIQIANIHFNAERYRPALKAFKEVRKCRDAPDDMKAEATYRSGLCYRSLKYNDSALMCMEEVAKKYPDSQWARQVRGQLYLWGELKPAAEARGEAQ